MARATTTYLALGVFDDGDNPGAGSKTVSAGNTGLNANMLIIDAALGTQHNTNGTHKDDVIDGNSLKSSVVDGSTLDVSSSTGSKYLKVKTSGIGTTQIANLAVTTGKLGDDSVDSTKLKDDAVTDANRAVTTNHIRDSAVTTAKIADGAVTSAKLESQVGWQLIYGDVRVAATSASSTPSAITEWSETGTTNIQKISFLVPNITGTRKLRIRANAKTSSGSKAWTVALVSSAGVELATATGINTSYDTTTSEVNISYTLTQDDTTQHPATEFQVHMRIAGIATASMKNLHVYITPS